MRDYKEIPLWRMVSQSDWTDWKWQIRNRLRDLDELRQVIKLTPEAEG